MKNREYYTNGNLKAEYERNERGEKEGYELLYYESGVLRAEISLQRLVNLPWCYKGILWNGNLVAEGNYRNGYAWKVYQESTMKVVN